MEFKDIWLSRQRFYQDYAHLPIAEVHQLWANYRPGTSPPGLNEMRDTYSLHNSTDHDPTATRDTNVDRCSLEDSRSISSTRPISYCLSQDSDASSDPGDSSRISRRVREQNRAAGLLRPIAQIIDDSSSDEVYPLEKREDRILIGKADITRQQPRIQRKTTHCAFCNDQPIGFHGDHELRRHIERHHSTIRKVWVCTNPPDRPGWLDSCKACRNGKTYGANYNAAAHLRRAHFNPVKNRSGGRNKRSEGRGGMGGGNEPSMEVLKHFMSERFERNINGSSAWDVMEINSSHSGILPAQETLTTNFPTPAWVESSDHLFQQLFDPSVGRRQASSRRDFPSTSSGMVAPSRSRLGLASSDVVNVATMIHPTTLEEFDPWHGPEVNSIKIDDQDLGVAQVSLHYMPHGSLMEQPSQTDQDAPDGSTPRPLASLSLISADEKHDMHEQKQPKNAENVSIQEFADIAAASTEQNSHEKFLYWQCHQCETKRQLIQPFLEDDIFCRDCHHSLCWDCVSSFSVVVLCLNEPVLRSVLGPIPVSVEALFREHNLVRDAMFAYVKDKKYQIGERRNIGDEDTGPKWQINGHKAADYYMKSEPDARNQQRRVEKKEPQQYIKAEPCDDEVYDESVVSSDLSDRPMSTPSGFDGIMEKRETSCERTDDRNCKETSSDRTNSESDPSEGESEFVGVLGTDSSNNNWSPESISSVDQAVLSNVVHRLVIEYVKYVETPNGGVRYCTNSSSSSASQQNTDQSSNTKGYATNSSTLPARKRFRPVDNEDIEDGESPGKRVKQNQPHTEKRLLACPFSKYDKERYSEQNTNEKHYRRCAGSYLFDISRLKQHLYRTHRRPTIYCSRCFRTFTSHGLLDYHSRAASPCDVEPCPFEEKMTHDQQSAIHKRRGPAKEQSEIWFYIYETLFPGIPKPASPYIDTVSPKAVESFQMWFENQQTVALVREKFATRVAGRFMDLSDQEFLASALEETLAELVERRGPCFHMATGHTQSEDSDLVWLNQITTDSIPWTAATGAVDADMSGTSGPVGSFFQDDFGLLGDLHLDSQRLPAEHLLNSGRLRGGVDLQPGELQSHFSSMDYLTTLEAKQSSQDPFITSIRKTDHSTDARVPQQQDILSIDKLPNKTRIGDENNPWFRLTDAELSELRETMGKPSSWVPDHQKIQRTLKAKRRGWADYYAAKTEAQKNGTHFVDSDIEAGHRLFAGARQ